MTRSLRNWLASLILLAAPVLAFPNVGSAQTFWGSNGLAPVALEARCRVADGMLESWPRLRHSGFDPLAIHVAARETTAAVEQTGDNAQSATAPGKAAGKDDAAPFCPFAWLASEEPIDVTGGPNRNCSDVDADCAAPGRSAAKASSDTICGTPATGRAIDPPSIANAATPATNNVANKSAAKVTNNAAAKIATDGKDSELMGINHCVSDLRFVPATRPQTPAPRISLVGSSPVIMLLDEEYLPYDLDVDAYPVCMPIAQCPIAQLPIAQCPIAQCPIRVHAFDLPPAECCPLPPWALADYQVSAAPPADLPPGELPPADLPPGEGRRPLILTDYLPNAQQLEFLEDLAQSMMPRLPMDCWMDEIIWQATGMLEQDGLIVAWMDGQRVGRELASLSVRGLQVIVERSRPVLPILTQPLQLPNQAAPQFAAPPQPPAVELEIAGSALIGVAEELESLAATLRGWGGSMHRIAAAAQPQHR
jgi:hypothetical protein